MEYCIYYGDISKEWAENWSEKNPNDNPFNILENRHRIAMDPSLGWLGLHLWADEHCTDRIEVDWGSRAWKCTGKELLELNKEADVYDSDSVIPERTYGVAFIEIY